MSENEGEEREGCVLSGDGAKAFLARGIEDLTLEGLGGWAGGRSGGEGRRRGGEMQKGGSEFDADSVLSGGARAFVDELVQEGALSGAAVA